METSLPTPICQGLCWYARGYPDIKMVSGVVSFLFQLPSKTVPVSSHLGHPWRFFCSGVGVWFLMLVTDAYFWSPSWHSVSLLNRLTSRVGFLVPIQRCAHSTLTIWWYTAFRTRPISTKSDAHSLTKITTIQIESFGPPDSNMLKPFWCSGVADWCLDGAKSCKYQTFFGARIS